MPFSEHLKPLPKQPLVSPSTGIVIWFVMACGNYFFYIWWSIAVQGSSSSLNNASRTIATMEFTALFTAALALCLVLLRMQRTGFFVMALVLPLTVASVFITN
jgi:hypothetical protein